MPSLYTFWKIFLLNREFWIYSVYLSILIICPLSSGCIGEYAIIFIFVPLKIFPFTVSYQFDYCMLCHAFLYNYSAYGVSRFGDLSVHSFHQIWNFFSYSVKFLLSSSFVPPPSLKLMTGGSLDIIPWVSDALFMFFPLFLCFYFLREPIAMYSSPLIFSSEVFV